MHGQREHVSLRAGDDMSFATFDFLTCILDPGLKVVERYQWFVIQSLCREDG